jgi:hypothetical protein
MKNGGFLMEPHPTLDLNEMPSLSYLEMPLRFPYQSKIYAISLLCGADQ